MRYIKVFCLESRFSENEILLDFDCIQVLKDRYVVMSDGEAQFSFPILPNHMIKPIKTFYADELDATFIYFKYMKEEEE